MIKYKVFYSYTLISIYQEINLKTDYVILYKKNLDLNLGFLGDIITLYSHNNHNVYPYMVYFLIPVTTINRKGDPVSRIPFSEKNNKPC